MGLLTGDGSKILRGIFSKIYARGQIVRTALDYSAPDGPVNVETLEPVRLQFDALTERQRAQEGASDSDVRVLVLADAVSTDDVLEALEGPYTGARYSVMDATRDPCGAYMDCRARRQG